MGLSIVLRQVLLYGHIIFFALALAAILKEDLRLMFSSRLDRATLSSTASLIKWLLLALWATGVPMVMMDIGTDFSVLLDKPKVLTKIIVVTALTLNGVLLHLVVFPMLDGRPQDPHRAATIASILGSVSTTSWLYASFIGVARIIAPHFSLYEFVALYVLSVMVGISVAIVLVRDRLERMLDRRGLADFEQDDDRQDLASTIRDVEASLTILEELQKRLRATKVGDSWAQVAGRPLAHAEPSQSRVESGEQTAAA